MSIINANSKNLGAFIADDKLYIPKNQRGYAWEEPQLEDYWIDLTNLFEENEDAEHFLGQIVIFRNKKEQKRYIIDGQQRISTTIILLDIFRSKFEELYHKDKKQYEDAHYLAEDITSKYIGRITQTTNQQQFHMGDVDAEFFSNNIQKRGSIDYKNDEFQKKKLKPSNYNIIFASQYFFTALDKFCADHHTDTFTALRKLFRCLTSQFILISVETDDMNEATDIFESLNARGKELDTADLLKNHIFRVSNDNIEEATRKWNLIIENLDDIDPTKFIRYYWNATNKFIREKDLYKALRKKINSPTEVTVLLKDLELLSEVFTAFLRPQENTYFNNKNLNSKILDLEHLDASSYIPIVFALVLKKFDDTQILKIIESIESLIVRNFIVSGLTANKYETSFSTIAQDITSSKLTDIPLIKRNLTELMVEDEKFINDFKMFSAKKKKVIRYLLQKINNYALNETKVIDDAQKVHIEHILPQKIKNGEWLNFAGESHKHYLWRLGNLTLLGQEYNNRAKNKEFLNKQEIYKKSEISITKELLNIQMWNQFEIEKRQERFANIALSIWPRE